MLNKRKKEHMERCAKLFEMMPALGFECIHDCRYRHIATGHTFDFSATSLELKDLIHIMIEKTAQANRLKGELETRRAFAALIDSTDIEEQLDNLETYG